MKVFLGLLASHFICDFALQSDWVGKHKSPKSGVAFWPWVMSAHAMTHAAGNYVVTGSILIAAFQFAMHFVIDFGKCLGWLTFNQDQIAHIVCCVLLAVLYATEPAP